MGLSLVLGPAHAGKVALLLERYLEAYDRDPWLVVPNRADVERVERDLLRRRPALTAGRIGTFDDLFAYVASGHADARPLLSEPQALLALRRAVARAELDELAASAGSAGFVETLLATLAELDSALLEPGRLDGDLERLARAYRDELAALDRWDRGSVRRAAVERLAD
ncbi:MAG TPA: hypothetical protein VI540_00020, partial [Gaiellaceae bacterium]|nr:hypothetical protein [Gaiellaceae bacterium]